MTVIAPVARHVGPRPPDVRPRLSRLGHPDELTGLEPPVQRTANYLIAAERELSHVQTRYFQARRGGDPDAFAAARARQDAAQDAISRLRARLHAERRQQLLEFAGSPAGAAAGQPSLLQRLFAR